MRDDRIKYEYLGKWAKVIWDCMHSGLTVKEFCAQNHIDVGTYWYWYHLVALEIEALGITD